MFFSADWTNNSAAGTLRSSRRKSDVVEINGFQKSRAWMLKPSGEAGENWTKIWLLDHPSARVLWVAVNLQLKKRRIDPDGVRAFA
jgi:hypothetical protein